MKQITKLPQPPTTAEPQNFDDRADAFVGALPKFVTETNELAAELEENLSSAALLKTAAQSAADSAADSAQTASEAKEAAARSASEAESSAQAASEAKTAAATSAQEAKESAQAAAETKEGLSGSLGALEEMKKIVATGFIDDSKVRTNLTYSSKKIESDFAPKNESPGEQKIYGKPLSAAGEASSVVVRDASGYISSSTPKSEEFTADHLVCVRGSDGKEKFVPLETIYKNVLERILKENLPLEAYEIRSIYKDISEIKFSPNFGKKLKNSNIFLGDTQSNGGMPYRIVTPDFTEVNFPMPSGLSSPKIIFLANESRSVILFGDYKFYKLIDGESGVSWERLEAQVSGKRLEYISQYANEFLYAKTGDNIIYKHDGSQWTPMSAPAATYYSRIELDGYKNDQPSGSAFKYFYEGDCFYSVVWEVRSSNVTPCTVTKYDLKTKQSEIISQTSDVFCFSSKFCITQKFRKNYNMSSISKEFYFSLYDIKTKNEKKIPAPHDSIPYESQMSVGYAYYFANTTSVIKVGDEYYGSVGLYNYDTNKYNNTGKLAKFDKRVLRYFGAKDI